MEFEDFFVNPLLVAAIGPVKGGGVGSGFMIHLSGVPQPLTARFQSSEDAHAARQHLINAVKLATGH